MITRPLRSLLAQPWLGRLVRSGKPATITLCYHDVCQPGLWPSWPRIEANLLDAHLTLLGKLGSFIGPDQVSEEPKSGIQILLTFDDGYASHLHSVLPLLRKHSAPAVFFISTGNVESGEPHWFDRIEMAVRNGRAKEVNLKRFGLDRYALPAAGPRLWWESLDRLLQDVKSLGDEDDPAVIDVIHHLEETASGTKQLDVRPLNLVELRRLAADPLAHIASHGHNHRIMTRLSEDQLMHQLTVSKNYLEERLDSPVLDIAYPNGDCDEAVQSAAKRAGYVRGYTAGTNPIRLNAPNTAIPRFLVGAFDTPPIFGRVLNESLLKSRRS